MKARKIPDTRSALANIAEDYENLLAGFAALVQPVWEERGPQTAHPGPVRRGRRRPG